MVSMLAFTQEPHFYKVAQLDNIGLRDIVIIAVTNRILGGIYNSRVIIVLLEFMAGIGIVVSRFVVYLRAKIPYACNLKLGAVN